MSAPSASAYMFVIQDSAGKQYDAYLDIQLVVDFYSWEVRYRPINQTGDKWTYLSPSRHPDGNFVVHLKSKYEIDQEYDTEEKCRAELVRICEGFSKVIKVVFGEPGETEPEPSDKIGLDGLIYLLKNKVVEQDNVLSLTE